MQAQLQKIGDGLGLMIPQGTVEANNLSEGDTVEFSKAEPRPVIDYATGEDAVAAYKRTEPSFANAYMLLGK